MSSPKSDGCDHCGTTKPELLPCYQGSLILCPDCVQKHRETLRKARGETLQDLKEELQKDIQRALEDATKDVRRRLGKSSETEETRA